MKMLKRFTVLLFVSITPSLFVQIDTVAFSRTEVMITMRDGIKLNTVIFAPKTYKEPLPIIFDRTPYGVNKLSSPNKRDYFIDMAKDGYIFVFQDIRGRYKSEGIFEMQRFMRDKKNPKSIDESTDTYDAIDWLVKNIPNNNGKVGMMVSNLYGEKRFTDLIDYFGSNILMPVGGILMAILAGWILSQNVSREEMKLSNNIIYHL